MSPASHRNISQNARLLSFENLEERRVMAYDAEMIADLSPGFQGSDPSRFIDCNGITYFSTNIGIPGVRNEYHLARTDGTANGTVAIDNSIVGLSDPSLMLNFNGTLYFIGSNGRVSGGSYGLYKTDGTAEGTTLIHYWTNALRIYRMAECNNEIYFYGEDYYGSKLWKSDGTESGTRLVKDFNPNKLTTIGISNPELANINGTLFFTADDMKHGIELWKSDGTEAGTVLVKDISLPKNSSFNPAMTSSYPQHFFNYNGMLIFTAADLEHGFELWNSDGTTEGTTLLKDLKEGPLSSQVDGYAISNSELYFKESENGILWQSDGTTSGTLPVVDISKYGTSKIKTTLLNGSLFFGIATYSKGTYIDPELWKLNGSNSGTTLVDNIQLISATIMPGNLTTLNDTLFFSTGDEINGLELWQSAGTAASTMMVKDINPGAGNGIFWSSQPTNINGTLYFAANDGVHGNELWKVSEVPSLSAILTDGGLNITDTKSQSNQLTIKRNLQSLEISDARERFISAPTGTTLSNNGKTLNIPLSLITGSLSINTGDRDDTVSIDLKKSFANSPIPKGGISIDLGTGEDSFNLLNDPTNNVWTLDGPQSGTVKVGALGTVTLQGVENVAGGTGVDVFKLTNAAANGIKSIKGNAGTDAIEVTRDADFILSNFKLTVTSGAVNQTFALSSIEQASLTGGQSNNFINAKDFSGPVRLNGVDGNDVLWGGTGNDILNGDWGNDWLSGNGGDDTLLGWNGRDILVGGLGADKLNGGGNVGPDTGDDLLIGGTTSYDTNKIAIDFLLTSWANPFTYTGHIAKLTSGVGPQNKYKLTSSTVLDDNAIDSLLGGTGLDWYFAGTSGTNKDTHDATGSEQVVGI